MKNSLSIVCVPQQVVENSLKQRQVHLCPVCSTQLEGHSHLIVDLEAFQARTKQIFTLILDRMINSSIGTTCLTITDRWGDPILKESYSREALQVILDLVINNVD